MHVCVLMHQTVGPCESAQRNSCSDPYAIACLPPLKGNCSLVRGGVWLIGLCDEWALLSAELSVVANEFEVYLSCILTIIKIASDERAKAQVFRLFRKCSFCL
jgi:hypothetical protein